MEQSLKITVGNEHYGIETPERRRLSERLGSPVDSLRDVESIRSQSESSLGSRPAHPGGSAQGCCPLSPRGHHHQSPSLRRMDRACSPSRPSWSHRGSTQQDGSLSRRLSPKRHSCSFRKCPHFLDNCSPSQHSESSVKQNLWTEFTSDYYGTDTQERRRRSDRLGSPVHSLSDSDRDYLDDDSAFIRGLSCSRSLERYHSGEKSPPSPFSTRHDVDYRVKGAFCQSDYNMNDDHLLDLSRGPDRDDKLFIKFLDPSEEEGLRQKRRNTSRDNPSSDYTSSGLINTLPSYESRYLYRPKEELMMPEISTLKKREDDSSMQLFRQNSGSCLRQKEYEESTPEPANQHGDFLFPNGRTSEDGNEFSHIFGRTAMPSSVQPKRWCGSLEVESEEKIVYGDDEDDSNISYPSTERLMNSGKEFLRPNRRLLSPVQPIKPDTSGEPRTEYEKIHDLLKTIGLDIGVAEIDKGAARTQERLHGKKPMYCLGGHSLVSHKPHSGEKDSIQGNTHFPESNEKNSLSSYGSFQPFNDVSSVSTSEHSKSKTLVHNNTGSQERSFPLISVTPSAPPSLPDLPPLPPPQYLAPYFSAFTKSQLLQHYPLSIVPPPCYNTNEQHMAYSSSAWPIYTFPQQSNPAFPDVQRNVLVTEPRCLRSNLRIIETVSLSKTNRESRKTRSALVEIPTTPSNSEVVAQSFVGAAAEKIPVENPPSFENCTSSNIRVIKTVYLDKVKREIRKTRSALVEIPTAPSNSEVVAQSFVEAAAEKISDEKKPTFEHGFGVGEKMPANEECNTGNGITVQPENNSNEIPHGALLPRNPHCEQSQEHLNKNPLCEDRMNLEHQTGLSLIQETECSLEPTQCGKEKEDRDEKSAEVARKEESESVSELRDEGNKN